MSLNSNRLVNIVSNLNRSLRLPSRGAHRAEAAVPEGGADGRGDRGGSSFGASCRPDPSCHDGPDQAAAQVHRRAPKGEAHQGDDAHPHGRELPAQQGVSVNVAAVITSSSKYSSSKSIGRQRTGLSKKMESIV